MLAIKTHSSIQNANSNLLIHPNETIIIILSLKTNNYTLEKCLPKNSGVGCFIFSWYPNQCLYNAVKRRLLSERGGLTYLFPHSSRTACTYKPYCNLSKDVTQRHHNSVACIIPLSCHCIPD